MKPLDWFKAMFGGWVAEDPAPLSLPSPDKADRTMLAVHRDGEWHVFTYCDASRVEAAEAIKAAPIPAAQRATMLYRMAELSRHSTEDEDELG